MAWTSKPIYIGTHLWFVPLATAFASPAPGVVSQFGAWPDQADPGWDGWAIGAIETFSLDPKMATSEKILVPNPGALVAIDEISPYATPEMQFTTLFTDVLAPQLALNTQQLWATATTSFNPGGGGAPGIKGILKAQKYDQNQNLILNWQSWAFLTLNSAWKGDPKTMSKPEYKAALLYSNNNEGSI